MSTSSDRGVIRVARGRDPRPQGWRDFYSKVAGWKPRAGARTPHTSLFVARRESKAASPYYGPTEHVDAAAKLAQYIGTPDVDATVRQAVASLGGK